MIRLLPLVLVALGGVGCSLLAASTRSTSTSSSAFAARGDGTEPGWNETGTIAPGVIVAVVAVVGPLKRTLMTGTARYRTEGKFTCIDLVTKSARQLFDMRDPSPFRERDLDDDAVEYLLASARDIGHRASLRVVIRIDGEQDPFLADDEIVAAVRAHLQYAREREVRQVRELLTRGRRFLLVGAGALALLLSAAELTLLLPSSHLSQILREGLVITGWVAMWRPLELLLYDWWPHVEQRRVVDAVLAGEILVVHKTSN
jgi:hypothetical protein